MARGPDPSQVGKAAEQAQRLLQAGDAQQAASLLAPIIQHAQHMPRVLDLFGRCLLNIGRHEQAVGVLRRAAKLMPQDPDVGFNLVLALRRSARYKPALQQVRQVRRLNPAAAVPAAMEADLLLDLDLRDEALAVLDGIEQYAPFSDADNAQLMMVRASLSDTDAAPGLARRMLAIADADTLPVHTRALLHNAAGRLLDRVGEVDAAFAALARARKLKAGPWDAARHTRLVDQCIELFTSGPGTELPAHGDGSAYVFILGMPRSGTSLLEQMLGLHPDVEPLGERSELMAAALALRGDAADQSMVLSRLSPSAVADFGRLATGMRTAMAKRRKRATPIATDKNPFNYLYVPLIARLLPGARVIHTTRDPLDTCWSNFRQWFNDVHGHLGTLEALGAYYCDYQRLMTAWEALPAPQQRPEMFEMNYEQLVAEPEVQMRRLCRFLGIDFQPQMLRPEESQRIVATASRQQVKQKLYSSSIDAWRPYAEHLVPLRDVLDASGAGGDG